MNNKMREKMKTFMRFYGSTDEQINSVVETVTAHHKLNEVSRSAPEMSASIGGALYTGRKVEVSLEGAEEEVNSMHNCKDCFKAYGAAQGAAGAVPMKRKPGDVAF